MRLVLEMENFWDRSLNRYATLIAEADVIQKVVYPSLIKVLDSQGAILDYGGGVGTFLSLLPGDREAALFDPSKDAVAMAERNCPAASQSKRHFWSSATAMPDKYFAEVVMCFVLMTIPTRRGEADALLKARAAMHSNAALNIVITHPRFRSHRFSCFETDFSRGREFDYDAVDTAFTAFLHGRDPAEELALPNFHRPLDLTLDAIRSSGFRIESATELYDYDEHRWFNEVTPPYLLIRARKAGEG